MCRTIAQQLYDRYLMTGLLYEFFSVNKTPTPNHTRQRPLAPPRHEVVVHNPHHTTPHHISIQPTTFHSTSFHTTPHFNSFHFIPHFNSTHHISIHLNSFTLHHTTFQFNPIHSTSIQFISIHSTSIQLK